MKDARALSLHELRTPQDAQMHVLRIRFAECLEKQGALDSQDDDAVHAFRLACKRLRFAIERSGEQARHFSAAAELLSRITDELGAAHDSVVLAERARACGAGTAVPLAVRDRNRFVRRGRQLWRSGFADSGAFAALCTSTGFHWRQP